MGAARSEQFTTESDEHTIRLGRELARRMRAPLLVLLVGNLGAGKTTLAKGIVAGLGAAVEDEVTSPSFTLIHEYGRGANKVFHADLYRLEGERQIATLGLEDLLDTAHPAILLIEWGEKAKLLFEGPRWEIHLGDVLAGSAGESAGESRSDSAEDRRRILVEEFDD